MVALRPHQRREHRNTDRSPRRVTREEHLRIKQQEHNDQLTEKGREDATRRAEVNHVGAILTREALIAGGYLKAGR